MSGGRKLAGLAQRRNRSGTLLQAGLLLAWQPERLVRLLLLSPADRGHLAALLRGRRWASTNWWGRCHRTASSLR